MVVFGCLLGAAPNGTFTFVSSHFEKNASPVQMEMVWSEHFLSDLAPKDVVFAFPKDFQNPNNPLPDKRIVLIPSLENISDKTEGYHKIGILQNHAERLFDRLKNYKILRGRLNSRFHVNKLIGILVALINFKPDIEMEV